MNYLLLIMLHQQLLSHEQLQMSKMYDAISLILQIQAMEEDHQRKPLFCFSSVTAYGSLQPLLSLLERVAWLTDKKILAPFELLQSDGSSTRDKTNQKTIGCLADSFKTMNPLLMSADSF